MTRKLLTSDAWMAQGINTRRLLDFLLVEHMNHAGNENGALKATHDQLRAYGLTGSKIREAIEEADFLGLLRWERGGRWAGSNQPSRFRLTFLADGEGNPPTNEWTRRTEGTIQEWKADRSASRSGNRKRKAASTSRSTVLPQRGVPSTNFEVGR